MRDPAARAAQISSLARCLVADAPPLAPFSAEELAAGRQAWGDPGRPKGILLVIKVRG